MGYFFFSWSIRRLTRATYDCEQTALLSSIDAFVHECFLHESKISILIPYAYGPQKRIESLSYTQYLCIRHPCCRWVGPYFFPLCFSRKSLRSAGATLYFAQTARRQTTRFPRPPFQQSRALQQPFRDKGACGALCKSVAATHTHEH